MSMRFRAASALLPFACWLPLAAQAPTVHDSAGIRVVESPSIAAAPVRYTLATTPQSMVGGIRDDEADELNSRISYPFGMRLSDGRIVADDADHWGIFAPSGKRLVQIGRGGAGPGEFRTPQNGCRFRGDSLLLWDVGNHRISIWGPDGKFVREYPSPGFAFGTSCLADGSILIEGAHQPSTREDLPVATFSIVTTAGTARATTPPLPATYYSGSLMREVHASGRGDRFYFADEVALGVTILDHAGHVIEVIRTRDRPTPVTAANLKTYAMSCTGDPVTKVCTPSMPNATTWPGYYGFAVGDDGRLWFRLNKDASDSIWVALDSTGRVVGKLLVPAGPRGARRRIVQFGRDDVLLSDFDDDGARRLSVYRIVRASPP